LTSTQIRSPYVAVVLVARVVPDALARLKIEVVNVIRRGILAASCERRAWFRGLCVHHATHAHIRTPGFPAFRKRGLETLTSYPHEGFVGDGVHADEQRILVNVCGRYKSIAVAAGSGEDI
jgi:hypothetical protein